MSLCCIPTSTVRTNPFVCRTNQVESLSWLLKSAINPHCSLVNVQFSSDFCSSTLHVLCFSPFFTYFVGHISYKSPWRCDPWSIHFNSPCFLVKFPWFFSLSCSINLSTPMPSISPSIPKEGILRNSLSKDVDLRLHLLEPRPGCSEIAQCCGAEDRVYSKPMAADITCGDWLVSHLKNRGKWGENWDLTSSSGMFCWFWFTEGWNKLVSWVPTKGDGVPGTTQDWAMENDIDAVAF